MKWFMHQAQAHRDMKLKKVLMRYGAEGYGLYWYCIEQVCTDLEPRLTFELEHDSEILAHELKIDTLKVEEMMLYMVQLGLFEQSDSVVTCFKLAAHLGDNLTRNPQLKAIIQQKKGNTEEGNPKGYVYFIESGHQVKIGYSANPWSRVKDIRSEEHPEPVLIASFKATIQEEKLVHALFEGDRNQGEWFTGTTVLLLLGSNIKKGLASTFKEVEAMTHLLRSSNVEQLSQQEEKIEEEKRRIKKGSVKKIKAEIIIPTSVSGAAWDEFVEYRKGKRKPVSQAAADKLFPVLSLYDFPTQQRMVNTTIQNDWAGLFEPKGKQVGQDAAQGSSRGRSIEQDLNDTSWAN